MIMRRLRSLLASVLKSSDTFVILITALPPVAGKVMDSELKRVFVMATLIKITRIGFASIQRRYRWYEIDGAWL
jgi:hypothetical protein